MLGNGHVRFGGRPAETGQGQPWNRAAGRPYDPATLIVAFDRVTGNQGAKHCRRRRLTVVEVEHAVGVPGFQNDIRAQLKAGSFRPLPVRERKIPKPGGSA
jgi:RNA-directed DNA polymerase